MRSRGNRKFWDSQFPLMIGLVLVCLILLTVAFKWSRQTRTEGVGSERIEWTRNLAEWIQQERLVQRPLASPLDPSELGAYSPYFTRGFLRDIRVRTVVEMPEPSFGGRIRRFRGKILSLSRGKGLCLGDTILLTLKHAPLDTEVRRAVLFGELVRSMQYREVGVETVIDKRIHTLATSGRRGNSVFDRQIIDLQVRFRKGPDGPLSVASEVARLTAQGTLDLDAIDTFAEPSG